MDIPGILAYVVANGAALAAVVTGLYAVFGVIVHLTKNTEDDNIYTKLATPVSWVVGFLSKKPAA